MLGLITSSFNIVPALLVPISLAGMLFLILLQKRDLLLKVHTVMDFRVWFAVYIVICMIYVKLIGINIFSLELYRREFKFIVPFSYLIVFSSFSYPKSMTNYVKITLVTLSFLSFSWLLFGLFDPTFHSKALYPFEGSMWEAISGSRPVYLGPFITHSAAGGFYAVLTLLLLGILEHVKNFRDKLLLMSALLMSTICLMLTGSRAFILSVIVVCSFLGLKILIRSLFRFKEVLSLIFITFLSISFSLALALFFETNLQKNFSYFMSSHNKLMDMNTRKLTPDFPGSDIRIYNAYVRLYFWKIAFQDFKGSPLIGVGPSRFDDDPRIISTIREEDIKKNIISVLNKNSPRPRYLNIPFFRVNIGSFVAHTDQHAHNVYLNVLAEGGILLFSIFAFMYFLLAYRIYHVSTSTGVEFKGLSKGVLYALSSVGIASFFGDNLLSVIPMVTIFCVASFVIGSAGRQETFLNVPFGDTKSLAFRRREETCILVACGDIAMARTRKLI